MTRLGVVFLPQQPPERLRAIAHAADEAGLEELWLWEDCFLEGGIATAAAALAFTERLHVGVGLLPVPLRNVAIAAMEVASLHRMFPGRVTVGLGHGVQAWMAQVGAGVESPMTLLREYVGALRALLHGERLSVAGRYVHLDGVVLDWPRAAGVHVGATGPRTLRLAGELADGTILTAGSDPDAVRRARRLIAAGQASAGRTGGHAVVVYLLATTGPDAAERFEAERVRLGYGEAVGAHGDAAAVAGAVNRWAAAGADTVVLQPSADDPDPEGFVRFVAQRVRPLVA